MKQAFMTGPGEISYRDVEKPEITPDSVLIKVSRIGICGSDVHVFEGKHPLVCFPLVQGHEFSGYVEEIGQNVKGFKRDDLVTVLPAIGCKSCSRCREGLIAQCEDLQFIGGALEGAGGEYILVEQKQVMKVPEGINADDAAMTEPLAVAVHAVMQAVSVKGRNIMVVGGGTIGNLTAQVARLFGPKKIVILEKIPFRRQLLSNLGLDALEVTDDKPVEMVKEAFHGESPDVAFECVGGQQSTNLCIHAVRRGGEIIIVGVYGSAPKIEMVFVQDKELILRGSLMYTRDDFSHAVSLLADKHVNVKILQTHHVPFENWIQGYQLLLERPANVLKVFVDL
jgi:L-iditol 2-dehydrogenase